MIKAKSIVKKYHQQHASILKSVSVSLTEKKIIVIFGPSGSGKTTLLNILSTLDTAYDGDLFYANKNIKTLTNKEVTNLRKEEIGFIFQSYELFPMLTVRENILVAANLMKKQAIDIEFLTDKLGITEQLAKYPAELSGGQQQRVAIARALVKNPKYVFCDEPTGALDTTTSYEVMGLIRDMNEKFGTTFIIVTHDYDMAQMADIIINMDSGQITSIQDVGEKINA